MTTGKEPLPACRQGQARSRASPSKPWHLEHRLWVCTTGEKCPRLFTHIWQPWLPKREAMWQLSSASFLNPSVFLQPNFPWYGHNAAQEKNQLSHRTLSYNIFISKQFFPSSLHHTEPLSSKKNKWQALRLRDQPTSLTFIMMCS